MKNLLAFRAKGKAAKSTQDDNTDAASQNAASPDAASPDVVSASASMDALPPTPPPSVAEPPQAPAASLSNRLMAFAKERSRRLVASAVNIHSLRDKTVKQARTSFLTERLPLELREMIWSFVLSPESLPYMAKTAHFHVYPEAIYDACTYDHERKRDGTPHLTQISLLLTCRGIHDEALRFLYEKQHFTIVLCAGLARPSACLRNRMNLGRAKDCKKLFARMRFVELIIQPGDAPELGKYTAHIASLLKAIDYGQHTKALKLHFNFGIRATNYTKQRIIGVFHQISAYHRANELRLPSCTIMTHTRWRDVRIMQSSAVYQFMTQLGATLTPDGRSTCNIVIWHLGRPTGVVSLDFGGWRAEYNHRDFGFYCLRRGAWGEYRRHCREHGLVRTRQPPKFVKDLLFAMHPVTFLVAHGVKFYRESVKGWTCPGYPNAQTVAESCPARLKVTIYHLPNTVPGSQEDRKALHYFSVSAAADIGGYFSADFWTRSILQRCQHDAPVRYAIAALSCVHREYVTSSVQAAFEASCQAVSGYVRAMKALRRYMRGRAVADRRVVTMCCAAFFCFELIRGEQGAALMHLQSGVSVLEQWQQGSHICTSGTTTVQETDRSQLVDVFARMDLQASAFDDGLALTARRSRLDTGVAADRLSDPSACSGPGLHAANYSLLLRRCFHFLVESAPWRRSSVVVGIEPTVLSARDRLIVELKGWEEHLDGVSGEDRENGLSSHLKSAIARSRFHCIIISRLIQSCVPSGPPQSSVHGADLESKSDELLQLAEDAIGASSEPGTASLSGIPTKRQFCLHLSIVAPLFLLALKTSRADVVTSCLQLLRRCKGRREGLYDADVIAKVIEALRRRNDDAVDGSLLDQMGGDAVSRLHEAVESVVPTKDDVARRVRGLCRLLALVD